MKAEHSIVVTVLVLIIAICGGSTIPIAEAENFEKVPIMLRASEVVPKEFLSGPNFTVKENIRNDGFVNIYELNTQYGPLKVESTALLLKRVAELRALSKIEELKGTDVYLDAAKRAALGPVKTATGVIVDPLGTATGVVSGIGNFLGKVSDAVVSSDPDKDKALNALAGQSAFKREFAYQFGIDPYTNFEPLQKALSDLAWTAGFAQRGMAVSDAIQNMSGVNGKELWITGTVDSGARKALEERGWKVEDKVMERLLKK